MALESLQWYNLAAKVLTNGSGIEYRFYSEVCRAQAKPDGSSHIFGMPLNGDGMSEGYFVNKEDIKALSDLVFKERTKFVDSKYYM